MGDFKTATKKYYFYLAHYKKINNEILSKIFKFDVKEW